MTTEPSQAARDCAEKLSSNWGNFLNGKEPILRAEIVQEALDAAVEPYRQALRELLQDTQHVDHNCGDDENCPVIKARKLLED